MSFKVYMGTVVPFEGISFKWPAPLNAAYTMAGYVYQAITYRWQEMVMLSGVVYAVIHATAALFQREFYNVASFLVLGAITGVGAFYMRQISILQKMEETQEKSSKQLSQLTKENSTLKQINQELNQTKEKLVLNTTKLELGNRALESSTSELRSQVIDLTTTKTALQDQVSSFKEQISGFTEQITILTHTATCISSEVALFQTTNELSSTRDLEFEKKLASLLGKISASIDLYKKLSSNTSKQQIKQNAELETIFLRFKKYLEEEVLMHRFQELGHVQKQLEYSTKQVALTEVLLKERIEELSRIDESLKKQRAALEDQITCITHQGLIYRDNNSTLSSTTRQLEAISSTLEKVVTPIKTLPEKHSSMEDPKKLVIDNSLGKTDMDTEHGSIESLVS